MTRRPSRPTPADALRARLTALGCPEELHTPFLAWLCGRSAALVRLWFRGGGRVPAYVGRLLDFYERWAKLRRLTNDDRRVIFDALQHARELREKADPILIAAVAEIPIGAAVEACRPKEDAA